jgi:Na+/melibiose symporter-like transporter
VNLKVVWGYLKMPLIFKPLVFILLVLISPGVENAMFYYNSNVLKFTSTQLGIVTVIGEIGTIFGQQFYRFCLRKYSFKQILFVSTLLYSLNSALKLLITQGIIQEYMSTLTFTYIISWLYNFVNAIHLMPIMVLACDMCP